MNAFCILLFLLYGLQIATSTSVFNCTFVTDNYPNTLLFGLCDISDISPSSFLLDTKITVPPNVQPDLLFSFTSADLSEVYYSSSYSYGNGGENEIVFELVLDILTCYVPCLQNGTGSFAFTLEATAVNCVTRNSTCYPELLSPVATSYQFVLASQALGQLFSVSQQYVQIPLTGNDDELYDISVSFQGVYPSLGVERVYFTSGDHCFENPEQYETAAMPPNVRNTTLYFYGVSPGNLFIEFLQFDALWKASVTATKQKQDDSSSWENYGDLFVAAVALGSIILSLSLLGCVLYVKQTWEQDKKRKQHEVVLEPLLSQVA